MLCWLSVGICAIYGSSLANVLHVTLHKSQHIVLPLELASCSNLVVLWDQTCIGSDKVVGAVVCIWGSGNPGKLSVLHIYTSQA